MSKTSGSVSVSSKGVKSIVLFPFCARDQGDKYGRSTPHTRSQRVRNACLSLTRNRRQPRHPGNQPPAGRPGSSKEKPSPQIQFAIAVPCTYFRQIYPELSIALAPALMDDPLSEILRRQLFEMWFLVFLGEWHTGMGDGAGFQP